MVLTIEIKNNLLNVSQLQEKMDEVIFDNIDTSHNWKKAYHDLDVLFNQLVAYYKNYVEQNDGKLPKSNLYWALFMDVAARLMYFRALSKKNLVNLNDLSEKEIVLFLLKNAVNCLSNVQKRNKELLEEISQTYEELDLMDGAKGNFKKFYYSQDYQLDECLAAFYELHIGTKVDTIN
ncbi:GTPase [Ureibacillus composti]